MDPSLLHITFHGVAPSPALSQRVAKEAAKLERFFDRITSCRVVIGQPHRHHRRGGNFEIYIEIGVPRERLVVRHEASGHRALEEDALGKPRKQLELQTPRRDPYVAVRDAFNAAQRRLEDYARRLRGDAKHHRDADAKGK